MLTYNNSDVIQCLRQYDMFANSLNLIKNNDERNMITKQLTKLEEKIIDLTNDVYEEEYNTLANKECELLEDEKNRVTELIELINQRLSYVEKRCNNHYQLTGDSIDIKDVLGASELDELENKARIIDKYIQNVKLKDELESDINSLTSKIELASEKIDINKNLNVELENTFKKVLADAFSRLGLYDMLENRNDIEYAYYETEKSLTLAQLNYETARTSRPDLLSECQEMLNDISKDYSMYKDQISIIKLMSIYDNDVTNYDELLNKRREINEILKCIKNSELLALISDTVMKQYNTIMMEGQDINTFNDLTLEKERKEEKLVEINEENNSEEFQSLLGVLIENEKKRQERILEEQKRIEEEEKKKRQEIERKKQEELLKKQKIIEEARKKEIEKRTKQLLEEQQNSVLQNKKKESKVSFENIKDVSLEEEKEIPDKEEEKPIVTRAERHLKLDLNDLNKKVEEEKANLNEEISNENLDEKLVKQEENIKNKDDIEKELFEEFNNKKYEEANELEEKEDVSLFNDKIDMDTEEDNEDLLNDSSFDGLEDKMSNNKFPDMSIDEYMRNFNENDIEKSSNLGDFGDDFPTIPM